MKKLLIMFSILAGTSSLVCAQSKKTENAKKNKLTTETSNIKTEAEKIEYLKKHKQNNTSLTDEEIYLKVNKTKATNNK